jgi:hypothetical protein
VKDLSRYEAFTCLKQGTKELDRDASGKLHWGWKHSTGLVSSADQKAFEKSGAMKSDEAWWKGVDVQTAKPVIAHGASVYWNDYRKMYVMIFVQFMGSSLLGEVWYSEADKPEGPWLSARKIVTHDNYTFYNPKQHPEFDQDGGRVIYFEGTYTAGFTDNKRPTPRYEYNQVMYRLDLSDPRLKLSR